MLFTITAHSTNNSSRNDAGFSLIELLVALLVIVMLTSLVSLNVGNGGRDIELGDSVRNLASMMAYVQNEAEMSGVDHGLYLSLDDDEVDVTIRGQWLRSYDQGWAAPRGSADVLVDFFAPEATALSLSLEGQPDIELTVPSLELMPRPQLVFFAGGEVTPGELDFIDQQTGELLYRLQWDLLGRSELLPKGEAVDWDEDGR